MIKTHDINCTGCTACQAICPAGAISMAPDDEGFAFPVIDASKCVGCGLCEKVCPIDNTKKHPYQDYCYIAVNGNDEDLAIASSGGMFPLLARYVLERGGVVCGCILDENCVARHVLASDAETVRAMSRSKYVQSDMGDCYRQTRKALQEGRYVLFSGTPCQAGGLISFLGHDYENLLTMDFACHGVPSPLLFKKHIDVLRKSWPDLKSVWFRNKQKGWIKGYGLTLLDGQKQIIAEFPGLQDEYVKWFSDFSSLRKSCSNCQYCTPQRASDFTVGDHWNIGASPFFDERGVSFILFNTSKALNWLKDNDGKFNTLERITLKEVGQPHFWMPYFRGKGRGKIFRQL